MEDPMMRSISTVSNLCQDIKGASVGTLEIVQTHCSRLLQDIFNSICDRNDQEATDTYIREGADGQFVEACLVAQEIPWPSKTVRMKIVEDASGILDNYSNRTYIMQLNGLVRLCRILKDMAHILAAPGNDCLSAGSLESLCLILYRLLTYYNDSAEISPEVREICPLVLEIINKPGKNIYNNARSAATDLVFKYAANFELPEDEELKEKIRDLFKTCLKESLSGADQYLRNHENYAKFQKEECVLAGMAAIRDSRKNALGS